MLVSLQVCPQKIRGGYNRRKLNKISFLLDFNTGTLVNDTTGIMTGNGLDARISYDRGFQKVPWLSVYGTLAFNATLDPINYNLANLDPSRTPDEKILYPEYYLNGMNRGSAKFDYFEGGVRFAKWGYVGIRSTWQILAEGVFPWTFDINDGLDISVRGFGGIKSYLYPIGQKYNPPPNPYGVPEKKLDYTNSSISDLYLGIGVNVNLLQKRLGLGLDMSWRTNGEPDVGATVTGIAPQWKPDSTDALKYNTSLRLNFTVSGVVSKNFLPYIQMRYEGKYLIEPPVPITNQRRGRPMHDVYLRLGFSCPFEF